MRHHSATVEQPGLFDDTETLPLFSGTAIRVDEPAAPAQAGAAKQETFADCPTCMDVGQVGLRFCWCPAGVRARQHDRDLTEAAVRASARARAHQRRPAGLLEF